MDHVPGSFRVPFQKDDGPHGAQFCLLTSAKEAIVGKTGPKVATLEPWSGPTPAGAGHESLRDRGTKSAQTVSPCEASSMLTYINTNGILSLFSIDGPLGELFAGLGLALG